MNLHSLERHPHLPKDTSAESRISIFPQTVVTNVHDLLFSHEEYLQENGDMRRTWYDADKNPVALMQYNKLEWSDRTLFIETFATTNGSKKDREDIWVDLQDHSKIPWLGTAIISDFLLEKKRDGYDSVYFYPTPESRYPWGRIIKAVLAKNIIHNARIFGDHDGVFMLTDPKNRG